MDTNMTRLSVAPRFAERTGFHQRDRKRGLMEELNMLDELWVEEGEPGKLILQKKKYNFYCHKNLHGCSYLIAAFE